MTKQAPDRSTDLTARRANRYNADVMETMMRVERCIVALSGLLLTVGCGDKGGAGPGGTNPTDSGATGTGPAFEDFINVDVVYTATQMDYTPGTDWLTRTADPSCLKDQTLDGLVSDFQEDEPVPGASVEMYFNDDIDAAADVSVDEVDSEGKFSATAPVCKAIGYKTSTPVEWEETKDTYEVHQVWGYEADGVLSETLNSVSIATASIIPAVLGVEWDPSTGIIAGTAYDSAEEPITGAQVFIHDGTGKAPPLVSIFYFISSFPNASQPYSSEDGLWVAVNVPVGTWTAEMWVWDGTQHVKLGQTVLNIKPDSVNISNIFTGFGDGIRLPDSCLSVCG